MKPTRIVTSGLLCSLLWAANVLAQPEEIVPVEEGDAPAEGRAPAEQTPADEGPPDEDIPFDDEPANGPAPKGKGVVWGTLTDGALNEPAIDAEVSVKSAKVQVFTNIDGQYRLELPPGTYDIDVWLEGHEPMVFKAVTVGVGELVQIDERLAAMEGAVDVIEVEEKVDSASTEAQMLDRKRSASVGDSVGRQDITRSAAKDAADAAKRVPGADIKGGRFVFVRGLGERYTNARLDGAPLPSPEPDRQTVPLDLFPTLMLESITINKTFVPDMPGDFAGGSVLIKTRRLPEEFTFSVSLGLGFNTQSTFRDNLTYRGGDLDWLGFDDGGRALSKEIPDYKVCNSCQKPDGSFPSSNELTRQGRYINTYRSTQRAITPPDHNGSLVVGNSWKVGGEKRLGVMGALTYSRSFEVRKNSILRTVGKPIEGTDGGEFRLQNDLAEEHAIDKVRWGALAGLTFEANADHRFHFTGLYSRSADDDTRELEGLHEERRATIHDTRLQFVARDLIFGQLRGEHVLDDLAGAELDWNLSLARATRSEPNYRGTVYQFQEATDQEPALYAFEDDSQSGMHFFSDQSERTVGGGLDWTQPLFGGDEAPKLKLGSLFSLRDRHFDARRFRFSPKSGVDNGDAQKCVTPTWDPSCSDQIFTNEAIGEVFVLSESTQPNDTYDADLDVFAGYLMADAKLGEYVRIIAGERFEASRQTIQSFDPLDPTADPVNVDLTDKALLPSAAIVLSVLPNANLRLGATRTLARPQLREMAPFSFTDFFGGREVQGNPDLVNTRIVNADLRFEWFPTLREVLAVSVFYKHFTDPIEETIAPGGARGIVTYENIGAAHLLGLELEARKSFDIIHEDLRDLSLITNVTLAHSKVTLTEEQLGLATTRDRALSRQAPWIANVALDYTNDDIGFSGRVLYNVFGPNIVQVGIQGLPDIYEQPRHTLDVRIAQELYEGLQGTLTAKNILNDDVLWTQGRTQSDEAVVRRYRTGVSFGLGASYTY